MYALYAYPAPDGSGTCLVTGGGDGKIKTWDAEVISRRWGLFGANGYISRDIGLHKVLF